MRFRFNLIRPAIVTPLAVGAGLGLGLAVGASAVAFSPVAASAIGVAITSVACSSTSGCVIGTNSSTGPGIAGTSAKGKGVSGTSTSSYGVYGSSKSGVGVKAVSSSSSAIFAANSSETYATINVSQSGTGYGINAISVGNGLNANGENDTGVFGTGLVQGGAFEGTTDAGVSGTTFGGGAAGVYGYDDTSAGSGSFAIQGESPHNVAGSFLNDSGNGADVLDVQGGTTAAGNYLMSVHSSNASKYMSVDDSGNVYYTGNLYHETACHGCHVGTRVRSYAPHESEPTMEDVGSSHLTNGSAFVALDPTFRNVVDAASDYHVLVTPEGDSNGVFVTTRNNRGFVVRENRAGRSSVSFSYRIVAKPLDSAEPRLPTIQRSARGTAHPARKPRHLVR